MVTEEILVLAYLLLLILLLLRLLVLEDFLPKVEPILAAFDLQGPRQLGWPAIEHSHLAFVLFLELLEHFVPVWAASVRSSLQTCD